MNLGQREEMEMSKGTRGMTDSELQDGIRRAYWGVNGLEKLLSNDLLKSAWPTLTTHRDRLQRHQDRLWAEYKRRHGHKERWPSTNENMPEHGTLTPDGYRKAYFSPDRLRKESLSELRETAELYADRGKHGSVARLYNDPMDRLVSAELDSVTVEYHALLKAEIARRERRRGRKAA